MIGSQPVAQPPSQSNMNYSTAYNQMIPPTAPVNPTGSFYNPSATSFNQPPPGAIRPPSGPNFMNPVDKQPIVNTTSTRFASPAPPPLVPTANISQASVPPPPPVVNNPPLQSNIYSPTNLVNQPPPTNASTTPTLVSYQDTRPSTGWNDPPMLQPKPKPVVQKEVSAEQPKFYQPTMPNLTAPPNYMATIVQNNNNNNNLPTNGNMSFNPIQNNTLDNRTPTPTTQATHGQRMSHEPVVEKPKLPMPSEYVIIQTIFDDLLKKCMDLSTSPAAKRKLEEVSKKLELLYDKLRTKTVK